MANSTRPEPETAEAFLARVEPSRQQEAVALDGIFRDATGFRPVVWGGSMLGYGRYRYRYDSGREGESLATGFAPRKADLVIYILPGYAELAGLLADLGLHRTGKSCLYLRRLDGIDRVALGRLIREGLAELSRRWEVFPE